MNLKLNKLKIPVIGIRDIPNMSNTVKPGYFLNLAHLKYFKDENIAIIRGLIEPGRDLVIRYKKKTFRYTNVP